MQETQLNKILNLLSDGSWHCTREMAALYIVDYRRRLVDLQRKGHRFESRQCTQHSHGMKEWRLIVPESPVVQEFKKEYETRSKQAFQGVLI